MKVEKSQYGYWVEFKPGRSRFFEFGTDVAQRIEKGLISDSIVKTRRAFAAGTHEPVVYYRDDNGINIPPSPDAVPPGVERLEIRTLRDADKLCREMSLELKQKFAYDCTDVLDDMQRDANGNTPRDVILHENNHPKTDYGREVTRQMLAVLDHEERERKKVNAEVRFVWRNS